MILRSAFWLAVGFAIMAPHGTNLGQAAAQLRDQAVATGTAAATQVIVGQVLSQPVASPVLADRLPAERPAASLTPMQAGPSDYVFPRPRPAALG